MQMDHGVLDWVNWFTDGIPAAGVTGSAEKKQKANTITNQCNRFKLSHLPVTPGSYCA